MGSTVGSGVAKSNGFGRAKPGTRQARLGHWLCSGALDGVGCVTNEGSSRGVQGFRVELGQEDEGSGVTAWATADVDAGEL
jgi:hypothetical protein